MSKIIDPVRREAALRSFWDRNVHVGSGGVSAPVSTDWNEQNYYLSESGIGTEEALNYLLYERPAFEDFLVWLHQAYKPGIVNAPLPNGNLLSAEDREFWDRNGYLVVKDAVPKQACEDARAAIWGFLGAEPGLEESWYRQHDGKKGLMLNFFQHAALDSNRRSPRIRKVYEELYASEDIYLLVDKVSFNPPETNSYNFKGSALHWDVSLHQPIPYVLQGLLYLNDVTAQEGAFHCVPGFHRNGGEWLSSLPRDVDARAAARTELKPVAVPGSAGDLVVWHQALPHCATANKGTIPRMVQYIAYKPLMGRDSETWI